MARCEECIHFEVCKHHAKMLEEDGYEIEFDDTPEVEKRCAAFKPTADVVPKSEVERLERICHSYALQYGTVADQQKVIDKAKAEAAREIFDDIKCSILAMSTLALFSYTDNLEESNAKQKCYKYVSELIDELDKRYTEGTADEVQHT